MSIGTTTNRNDYPGAGATGPFAYAFKIFAATELLVTKRSTGGVDTPLTYITDYSVTGVGDGGGGTITLVVALATGETLTVRRGLAVEQPMSIRNQGAYYPATVEDECDRLTMIDQKQQDEIDRAVKLPETVNPTTVNMHLPVPVAGKVLAWNGDGTGLTHVDPVAYANIATEPSAVDGDYATSVLLGVFASAASKALRLDLLGGWLLRLRGVYSVQDPKFGAKGDGVTNDAPAIQAAINAAIAAKSTVVVLPPGNYLITSTLAPYGLMPGGTLVQGVRLIGFGMRGATVITANIGATSDAIQFWHTNATYGEGGGVEHVFLQAAGAGYQHGIHFHNWGHFLVDEVRTIAATGDGIRVCGGINGTIRRPYGFQCATAVNIGQTASENGPASAPVADAPLVTTTTRIEHAYASACTIGLQQSGGYAITWISPVGESSTSHGMYAMLGSCTIIDPYFEANAGHHLKIGDISLSAGVQVNLVGGYWYGGTGAAPNAGAAIFVSKYGQMLGTIGQIRSTVPRSLVIESLGHVLASMAYPEGGTPTPEWRTDNDAAAQTFNAYAYGIVTYFGGGGLFGVAARTAGTLYPRVDGYTTPTYSASMAIDSRAGNEFVIIPSDGAAFTIGTPSSGTTGQRLTITVVNSFGVLGVATFTGYKMTAWTQPANGFRRSITFYYNGTAWYEESRTAADIPN